MEKAWYWKVIFVLALVVWSVLYLLPTFIPDSLPEWYTGIFEKKVNLGLDLQGGIHLVLGVEVDKALEDKADQYVRDFKATMKEKRIGFKKVYRIPGTWSIRFELEKPDDKPRLEKRVLDGFRNLKQVSVENSDTVVQVTFDEKYVDDLRKNARDQAQITVRNRVDEFGVAEPEIAPQGETGILVQLPGMFDPERAKSFLGRTAQLEFKMVDDESDFIASLKDKLPKGVIMREYPYEGPKGEIVTERYLVARGKGNEGRNILLDFFNNAAEIEKFLKSKNVDKKLIDKIMLKVKGGLTPIERKEIMEMAAPVLGAVSKTASSIDSKSKSESPDAKQPETNQPDMKQTAANSKESSKEVQPKVEKPDEKPSAKKVEVSEKSHDMLRLEKLLKGKVPEGHEIGFGRKERQLEVEFRTYYLKSEVAMTGDYITDARVSRDQSTGSPEVSLTFDRTGANIFEKLTGDNVKRRMAIVLEGEVASAPVIQTRIGGGRARITLGSSRDYNEAISEAKDLAKVLRAGALPAPVRILEERTVGPTMGEDARKQGVYALMIGMVLVVLFMFLYYRLSGFIADIALILNALFIMAVMAAFQATLTLPGIAGIILTIGMAVDANVIINERIREELHSGKTPRAAVDAGYGRAFWTIFDSNFTTLIAAVVLWSYGSGPIQGFAVTLFVGILASMFTAIFVTRIIIDWVVLKLKVKRLSI